MLLKIFPLVALYFYLDAYLVNATIRDVDEKEIKKKFFSSHYIKRDTNFRITNLVGDIKSVRTGTLDETCKKLQIRRLQKLYPTLSVYEPSAEFGNFRVTPAALGADSIAKYDERVPHYTWEIGQFEYLLLPVYGTLYTKEIYHVPSLTYVDYRGDKYSIGDGYFAPDDYGEKGRPFIFEITKDNRAKLVAYEDMLRFAYYGV